MLRLLQAGRNATLQPKGASAMKNGWRFLIVACVLAIGMYAYTAPLGRLESSILNPADSYYNLLVQGFRDGHLSVRKEVPTGFARLPDPYDPDANRSYRGLPYGLSDLSYYKGHLYLYFGVTPALILFWPFVALTGHYLFGRTAATVFCSVGIIASLGLLRALRRRYFPEVGVGVVVACALALSLATAVPTLLPQSDIYQVAISCGYMLTMLALGGIWCALHETEPRKRSGWLAAASVAYGLAVGARPSLVFGAVILLVPVIYAWRERQPTWAALIAATVPIMLIGLGLMLYNFLRFENPFEFGVRYQLGGQRQVTVQFFRPSYLWFNFRVYFLEPVRWKTHFPFERGIAVPPMPKDYNGVTDAFGILANTPVVWLALAVPLAWRDRSSKTISGLYRFVVGTALLFCICAAVMCMFVGANSRYEVDFLPELMMLAVIGILSLEYASMTPGAWLASHPAWRRAARCGWGVLLGFSIAFNLLLSAENYTHAGCSLGTMLALNGRVTEAIRVFESSLRIEPDYADGHNNLGIALWQAGKRSEAIREYEYALRLNPDFADVHVILGTALVQMDKPEEAIPHYEEALQIYTNGSSSVFKYGVAAANVDIGNVLLAQGKVPDAAAHYEEALRFNPDNVEAHYNLGAALIKLSRLEEAIRHCEEALRIDANCTAAHVNLGNALLAQGKMQEAMAHYEEALRINPDDAQAHSDLGNAFLAQGRTQDAIIPYEEALRINPNDPEIHYNLGIALGQVGRVQEAMEQWELALRIKPDEIDAHYNLGVALEKLGRVPEAIDHYQQALKLRPDFAAAKNALMRLRASQ